MNSGESADLLETTRVSVVSFSEAALHTLFGESHLGILIFDKQGQIHYRNPRALQLLKAGRMRDLERILAKPSAICAAHPSYIIVDSSDDDSSQVFRIDDEELPDQFVLRTIAPVHMPAFENEVCSDKPYSANIVVILDQHGTIISCSETVGQVTQLPLDQIVGRNFIELTSPLPGFPLLSLEKACERSLQCCIRFGGQDKWVNVSVKPIYGGNEVQYIVAIYDIATLKRQQQESAQQEKMAAIGQMAARLAHEIKNPLTSIKGFLQLIQLYLESGNRQKLKEYLATALSETEHLSNLVTDFLNYALPSQPRAEVIEVNQLFEEMLLLLRRVCSLNNIECSAAVEDRNLAIVGDRHQVQQILLNIAYNAIDALKEAPQRKLLLAAAANGSMCELSVTNTGPQIPREVVKSIFDPFFTTKDSGTGLGLSTCARLARENGGHIEVSTTPQLTAFHIFLPLAQDGIKAAAAN